MHGITNFTPRSADDGDNLVARLRSWVAGHRRWLTIVALPTLLVAGYYYLVASDQYVSEAHFLVRSTNPTPPSVGGLGAALGLGAGGASGASDTAAVADYLTSHDAVDALEKRLDIAARYSRPGIDPVSRLRPAHPTPERLLGYVRDKVEVRADPDTGVAILRVRSFSPQDSYQIAQTMLALGEERVNALNQRSRDSTLGVATRQLAEAERAVSAVQAQLTAFRRKDGDFNPQVTGTARVELVSTLQGQLAAARAQYAAMRSQLSPNSPQLVAMRDRVRGLEAQVAAEQGKLARGAGNVATSTGTFEALKLRQEFAAKRYDLAASAVQQAREQIIRQQLFVVQVVKPNMPGKSLYPQRWKIVLTVFVTLLLAYGIGWLIAAGVREHAA